MRELGHESFDGVTFLPCRPDRTFPRGYGFGIHDANGQPLGAFDHPWCGMFAPEPATLKLPAPAIYGGMLMDHFGHFLMEAMSRLWFIHAHPDLPTVWHWIDLPVPHSAWAGWIDEAWAILGLGGRPFHIVRSPVRIDQVLLPESGLLSSEELHPLQARALARCASTDAAPLGRVWLSRHGIPSHFGRLDGEGELETQLAAAGWDIVRPQTMSVADQAGLFARAEVVAGFAGSAFHAALLTAEPRARLLILDRPSVDRGYYRAVARARGLKQAFLAVPLEAPDAIHAWTTFRLVDPRAVARTVMDAADDEAGFVAV